MGLDLSTIFAGGVEGLFKGVRDVIGAFKADPTVALQAQQKLAELEIAMRRAELDAEVALSQAQTKINEIEAASTDAFVRRARPAAIWVCVFGLTYATAFGPLLTWVSEWIATGKPGPAPALNTDVLTTTLFGLLGIAGMRSFDKMKGTAR